MKEKTLYCYLVTYVVLSGGVNHFENIEVAEDKPIGLGFAQEFLDGAKEKLLCSAIVSIVSIGNYTQSEWDNHKAEQEVRAAKKLKEIAKGIKLDSEGFQNSSQLSAAIESGDSKQVQEIATEQADDIESLKADNELMKETLQRISKWEDLTAKDRVNIGSNGERDHYRVIAHNVWEAVK